MSTRTTPYHRIRACGYDAEIKASRVGWRVYLLDARGRRTGIKNDVPRNTCGTVAGMNDRMKSERGFRSDSRLHQALVLFAEHCERVTHKRQAVVTSSGPLTAESLAAALAKLGAPSAVAHAGPTVLIPSSYAQYLAQNENDQGRAALLNKTDYRRRALAPEALAGYQKLVVEYVRVLARLNAMKRAKQTALAI